MQRSASDRKVPGQTVADRQRRLITARLRALICIVRRVHITNTQVNESYHHRTVTGSKREQALAKLNLKQPAFKYLTLTSAKPQVKASEPGMCLRCRQIFSVTTEGFFHPSPT